MDSLRPARWKILLAFGIVYFVWGSTFLAIRIGVREVPPFLLAAMRFLLAGLILFAWMRARKTPSPTVKQWGSATLLAVLIFVLDYGLVFWAEQTVPSGLTAVMLATIPVFMSLSEILFLGTRKFTVRLGFALLAGIAGVLVLVSHSLGLGEQPIATSGAVALLIGSISWAIASALSRKLPLPESKPMSSAAQMLSGGVMLAIVALSLGELRGFRPQDVSRGAWIALAYLVVAGSIVAFTAYVWLLHHESPTLVGTYAYVNPVVAVIVGYFFGGEGLGLRTLLGSLLVLVSVVVITTSPRGHSTKPAAIVEEEYVGEEAAGD